MDKDVYRMNQEQYQKKHEVFKEERERVAKDPWRLRYHIMSDTGWLNDPNGLCHFHGIYHVYYQYSPFDVEGKIKLWGHMTSKDLCSWTQEEPLLFPDSPFDERGVYSGSAFLHDDQIYFYYTGNVKHFDKVDYDYIHAGREQNTILVTSKDGFHVSEKKLLMSNDAYPSDMSCHVRDPKIYEKDGMFYMMLGARDLHSKGCVLVYKSMDLTTWSYCNRLETPHPFGYMWECPDFFDLNGHQVLLTCPQGVKQSGYDYANVHQCGCFLVDGNIENEYTLKAFQQLDRGFDFYAPQTFLDEKGRRILIGWMGLPDIEYTNPTTKQGWQHALTIPRVLHVKDNRLIQRPIEELKNLRKKEQNGDVHLIAQKHLIERVYEMCIDIVAEGNFTLWLRNTTSLTYENQVLTLSLDEEGYGRGTRQVKLETLRNIQIFSDTSSLEIFVNDGEEVFTTRVYETIAKKEISFTDCKMDANVVFYNLDGYVL